jgi:hypothetical protein
MSKSLSEGGLGQQGPWPNRYRVMIQDVNQNRWSYNAIAWFGEAKAVALAVERHLRRFPESDARSWIYDVIVASLGPAQVSSDGTTKVESGDLSDRYEW